MSRRASLSVLFGLMSVLMILSSGAGTAQASFPAVGISQSYQDFGLKLNRSSSYQPDYDVSRSVFWAPLGSTVKRLRVIIPWDIGDRAPSDGRRQEFENWLKRVGELEAEPYVVFGPTQRSPSTDTAHNPPHFSNVETRCCSPEAMVAPPGSVYETAIKDFLAIWGPGGSSSAVDVRVIGAWNEPNVPNVSMSGTGGINGRVFLAGGNTEIRDTEHCPTGATATNCGPLGVAWFWLHAKQDIDAVCTGCTVVAGEFDSDGEGAGQEYWNIYANKIESITTARPSVISFHGHHDVEALGKHVSEDGKVDNDCKPTQVNKCITNNFSAWLNGRGGVWASRSSMKIWDTEVGAQHEAGEAPSGNDDTAQLHRFENLISMGEEDGVSRLYYFNFQQQNGSNDRGLLDSAEVSPYSVNKPYRPIWQYIRCPSGCSAWQMPAPGAQTLSATGIGVTGGSLNGLVSANGTDTNYHFEYGTTTSYGSSAGSGSVASPNTTAIPVSTTLSGLQPNTAYHYRVVAESTAGTTAGADQVLTTLPVPKPGATASPATDVKAHETAGGGLSAEATLHGVVNPNGFDTHYRIEWGTSLLYGSSVPVPAADVGSGSGGVSVQQVITGLQPTTTYHFRVAAENAGGTTYSSDEALQTPDWRPVVSGEGGESTGAGEATLKASVNPQGFDTHYYFEYGATPAFGSKVPAAAQDIGSGSTAVEVSQIISGLADVHGYYLRLVATSSRGTTYGATTSFATAGFSFASQIGSPGSGDGQLSRPYGLAVDSGRNVWVVDNGGNRLQKFSPGGAFLAKFGSSGSGLGQFNRPFAVAVTAAGNLWVTDFGNNRVQEFNSKGEYITQFGTHGPENGQFQGPTGIAIDSGGHLWVADWGNNRVQEFSSEGAYMAKFGTPGVGNGQISRPTGIAVGPTGHILVTGNSGAQEFTTEGGFVHRFGTKGSGEGELGEPTGIAVDPEGHVLIAAGNADTVKEYGANGAYLTAFGSQGSGNGQFNGAGLLAFNSEGDLWAGDIENGRVQEWLPAAAPVPFSFASQIGSPGSGDGQLSRPYGLAVDSGRNVWVVDSGNNRVQELSPGGAYLAKFGSSGTGNGQFNRPFAVAVTSGGNLWVTDFGNNRVQEFNSKGEYITQFGTHGPENGQFQGPTGIAIDAAGHLWVADWGNNRVQEFSSEGAYMAKFGTPGVENGQISRPTGIAVGPTGHILVTGNSGAQEFTTEGGFVHRFGTKGSGEGELGEPTGIAVDPEGHVLIAAGNADTVKEYGANGAYLTAFGSQGSGNGQFNGAGLLAFDSEGDLWAGDIENGRVQEWTAW